MLIHFEEIKDEIIFFILRNPLDILVSFSQIAIHKITVKKHTDKEITVKFMYCFQKDTDQLLAFILL